MSKTELAELEKLIVEDRDATRIIELAKKLAELVRAFVDDDYIILEP